MKHAEDTIQEGFFSWVRENSYKNIPLGELCFAIPNGGNRNLKEAVRLKRQGVLSGVSDVFMAIPMPGSAGLWIEFKSGTNKLSENQQIFKENMIKVGYSHVICYSAMDAILEATAHMYQNIQIISGIDVVKGKNKYLAFCRSMGEKFKTKRGAIGFLRRRGFNEKGERI